MGSPTPCSIHLSAECTCGPDELAVQVPKIPVTVEVGVDRISDLLCCAFEGGSNYWYMIDEYIEPTEFLYRNDPKQLFKHLDYPLNPGGALIISDDMEESETDGHKTYRLDIDSITKGLGLMAVNFPAQFAHFLNENEDVSTGGVFLQLCLFGEVIYG